MTTTPKQSARKPAKPKTGTPKPASKPAARKRESRFLQLDERIVSVAADNGIDTYEKLLDALGKTAAGQPVKWRTMYLAKTGRIPATLWTGPVRKSAKTA